jgi:hypothetical protein
MNNCRTSFFYTELQAQPNPNDVALQEEVKLHFGNRC